MPSIKRALIGEKSFYKEVAFVVAPIIAQETITNFVSLLDNLMVGQVGTVQMSGVAITNTLLFVFYLCVFGAISGAGIFGAQFYGSKDEEGVRNTFRYKLLVCMLLIGLAWILFLSAGRNLIGLYLTDTSDPVAAADTLRYAQDYLRVMLLGLLPFALTASYAGTLRETGNTTLPMFASIAAVLVNLAGNYLLIFGNFGCPKLGVRGAAIATVLSRFVELSIILLFVHARPDAFHIFRGAWRKLKVPAKLARLITVKGMPLLINECLWSLGMATLKQLYSMRGLAAVAGFNISDTVVNLFNVVYLSMGNAAAIMVGQRLGADRPEDAKRTAWNIIFLGIALCMLSGAVTIAAAPLITGFYNTSANVRALAAGFIRTNALFMPAVSLAHCSYFILRSGGKTLITFLFDSAYTWIVIVPLAAALIYLTKLPVQAVYPLVLTSEILKAAIGFLLVKKGVWIHNIVKSSQGKLNHRKERVGL